MPARAKALLAFYVLILTSLSALSDGAINTAAAVRFQVTQTVVAGQPDDLIIPDMITLAIPLRYDTAAITRAAFALSALLAENGYPYSKITTTVVSNGDSPIPDDFSNIPEDDSTVTLTIRFAIDPDERVCNGPPLVVGAGKRADMYLRDVRLAFGRPYSSADVDETLRRLSLRPYVREATAGAPVIIEDVAAHGDCRTAVTPFNVAENRGMEADGAIGYESGRGEASGRMNGRLDLSFMNMLRHGESFKASYAGTRDIQRLGLAASRPWMFGLPLELGVSAGLEIEDAGYGFMSGEFFGASEINAKWKYGAALKGSETVPPDTIAEPYRFYGADVFLSLYRLPWERGRTVRELYLLTGSGTANRERVYVRNRMELAAGTHQPIRGEYAAAVRMCALSLFTDEDHLPPAEQYRLGGHGSLRGYSEDEFAFRSVVYSQIEWLYYFNRAGAAYIFTDGGVGFGYSSGLKLSEAQKLFGYGVGLRFPSRIGAISVEWARNMDDGWGLGRVHAGVRINNK